MFLSRRRQRGAGLLDALVALAILAFGVLALSRFQARTIAAATESQTRLAATRIADELLNLAIVDPANVSCYTVPAVAGCVSAAARAVADDWAAGAVAALPSTAAATASYDAATNRLTVELAWSGRSLQEGQAGETRRLSVTSDVR